MGCFEYTQMIFYWCAFDQKEQKVMGKGQMMRKRQQIKQKDKKKPVCFSQQAPSCARHCSRIGLGMHQIG